MRTRASIPSVRMSMEWHSLPTVQRSPTSMRRSIATAAIRRRRTTGCGASNHASDFYFESISEDTSDRRWTRRFIHHHQQEWWCAADDHDSHARLGREARQWAGQARQFLDRQVRRANRQRRAIHARRRQRHPREQQPARSPTNDPNDANTPSSATIQQAWVQHLVSTWGLSASGGLQFYILDNEHSIWQGTCRDTHPVGADDDRDQRKDDRVLPT